MEAAVKTGQKRYLLGAGLVVALAAAAFAPSGEGEVIGAIQKPASMRVVNVAVDLPKDANELKTVLQIHPREGAANLEDAFLSTTWEPPAAVEVVKSEPVAELPPEPEQAPPLPFKLLGRFRDGTKEAVFLQHNDRTLVVHVGEKINDSYQIESIADGTVTLLYLPLEQRQTLTGLGSN